MQRHCCNTKEDISSSYQWILICIVLLQTVVFCKYSIAIDTKSLATLWLLDEGNGQIISDETNNNHIGRIGNPNWVVGKFGGGLKFQGQSTDADYVIIPHHKDFDFAKDDFTVGCWVDSKKDDTYIITKRKSDPDHWWKLNSAIDRPGNFFGFEYAAGGAGLGADFGSIDGKVEIVNTGWHHVAVVKSEGRLQLYIDGILDVQKEKIDKNEKWSIDNKDRIQIGGWGKFENFVGSIDEIFIAKRAFNSDDLKKIMRGWKQAQLVSSSRKLACIWGTVKQRN